MTFWEVLSNMSDFLFVFSCTLFFLMLISIALYSIITKTSFEEIMKAGAMEDIKENECIKRLDKLQDTLDCLASKHLDAETMRELQGASEESENRRKQYIAPALEKLEDELDEESFEEWAGMLNSTTDRLINIYSEQMKRAYSKMPADDDIRHECKRAKLEEEIYYCRFFIAFYSFVQVQGLDAFEIYLRRMCFMPANEEAIERKNNIEGEEPEKQRKTYMPPELTFLENEAQKMREDLEISEQKNDEK